MSGALQMSDVSYEKENVQKTKKGFNPGMHSVKK